MCNHLHPREMESQKEIVLCEDEDCNYKFLAQCLKCAFKSCKSHFVNCKTGDKFEGSRDQLQQKYNEMEKLIFDLNQRINQKLAMLLQQCKYILNKVEQFCENCFFEDIIPFNFNIDYLLDMQKVLKQEIDNKIKAMEEYINEFQQPYNLHNKKESKIQQKYSILYEQNHQLVQAMDAINNSLKIDPLSLFSIYQKGNILLKQHQYDQAQKYLFKVFLLSKVSNKKELKSQIFLTLQENCLFKMKKYNYLIELSNNYSKDFDEMKVSMFKAFAEFNKMEYENALNSLKEVNLSEIANCNSSKFKDQCKKAYQKQQDLNQQSNVNAQDIKNSLFNFSNISRNKNVQKQNQETPNSFATTFKEALKNFFTTIINQDNDENLAFLNQKQQFMLEIQGNEIHLVNLKSNQTVKY